MRQLLILFALKLAYNYHRTRALVVATEEVDRYHRNHHYIFSHGH